MLPCVLQDKILKFFESQAVLQKDMVKFLEVSLYEFHVKMIFFVCVIEACLLTNFLAPVVSCIGLRIVTQIIEVRALGLSDAHDT